MPSFLVISEATDGHGGAIHFSHVLKLSRAPKTQREILDIQEILGMECGRDVVYQGVTLLPEQSDHPGIGAYGYYLHYVTVTLTPRYSVHAGNMMYAPPRSILTLDDIRAIEESLCIGRPGSYVRLKGFDVIELTPENRERLEQQGG